MEIEAARRRAREIFAAGLAAADPFRATQLAMGDLARPGLIVAVGKAARAMAEAALSQFGGVPCIVVTNAGNDAPLAGARVHRAGHPVPDAQGARAAQDVLTGLRMAEGPVLALISGGGSAMLPAPVPPITLAEKARLNELLLAGGLDIRAMNCVRQQISSLKGGGFLRAAAPQKVTALILSDVVGDDLSVIASGPTVAPVGTAEEAAAILRDAGLWEEVPGSIRDRLLRDAPPAAVPEAENRLIGSNGHSVAAMAAFAGDAAVLPALEGDVADAARRVCDAAGGGVTIWGGETTVRLRGDGRGGRNQELALRIAIEARRRGWTDFVCLQGGSDGRDGPTDAAGGLVDGGTLERIAAAGHDVEKLLENNDSCRALEAAGDLLMTGATGTNVADLGVMIRP